MKTESFYQQLIKAGKMRKSTNSRIFFSQILHLKSRFKQCSVLDMENLSKEKGKCVSRLNLSKTSSEAFGGFFVLFCLAFFC